MLLQQIAPCVWALTQSIEPALEFRISLPPASRPAQPPAASIGDPFVPLGCFASVDNQLQITISAMFLPRPASAGDLLGCVLQEMRPSACSTRSSLAEAEATVKLGPDTTGRIRLVLNGRFAVKVEIHVRADEFVAKQLELAKISESFSFRRSVPIDGCLEARVDPHTGVSFQHPRTFSCSPRHEDGATEYLLADPELGFMRVLLSGEDAYPLRIAQDFASWFRSQGCVLGGASVAAGREPGHYCYAPSATCHGVDVTTGVTIFRTESRFAAVGFIAPCRLSSPWRAAMMKWATDTAVSTCTTEC